METLVTLTVTFMAVIVFSVLSFWTSCMPNLACSFRVFFVWTVFVTTLEQNLYQILAWDSKKQDMIFLNSVKEGIYRDDETRRLDGFKVSCWGNKVFITGGEFELGKCTLKSNGNFHFFKGKIWSWDKHWDEHKFCCEIVWQFCKPFYFYFIETFLGHGQWFTDIMTWDSLNKKWEKLTSISFGRRHHSSIIVGNYIYLLGGFIRHRDITGSFVRNPKFSLKSIYFQYVFYVALKLTLFDRGLKIYN